MAYMHTCVFGGKDGIEGDYNAQGQEEKDRSTEEILLTFLSHQPLLKYSYSVLEGEKMETHASNIIFNIGGFLEVWRQECLALEGHALLEETKSQELAQAGKEILINGEASGGYPVNSKFAFVKGVEEGRRFTVGAELCGRPLLHLQDVEGRAHGRDSPGVKQRLLSAEGRRDLLEEEFLLPIMNKKLQLSGLEEDGYTLVIENNCCKVTIQFGDNAAAIQILENYDSGISRCLNIQSDCQLPTQSKIISRFTKDGEIINAKENGLSKLEERCQHIDVWLKGLGEKCNDYCNSVPTDSSRPDSSSISSNRVLDSAASGGYCSVSGTELKDENDSRLFRTVKLEREAKGLIKSEDNYPMYSGNCCASPAEGPPEGLLYVLPYLQLRELLALEQVSRSLRDSVQNDVLLWKSLLIEHPLSKKVTDDVLLRLSARAQGHLHCLSLLECGKITDYAVRRILASNPMLLKLCLPGCTRISADAVVTMVKEHTERKSLNAPSLKQLRIRGLYGITKEHVEQLYSMLFNVNHESNEPKPRYYRYGHYPAHCEDDRLIDVEVCPKCTNVRVVYDCTREKCQRKQTLKLQQCRGCTFCIARCEECGTCIDDTEYEETFCLDLLCSACWLRLPKCAECNRPGCGMHVDHFIGSPDTVFLCADCHGSPGEAAPEFYVP